MTIIQFVYCLAALFVLGGSSQLVSADGLNQADPKIDLYRLDLDDGDLNLDDLDQFRGMTSSSADQQEFADFSKVDEDELFGAEDLRLLSVADSESAVDDEETPSEPPSSPSPVSQVLPSPSPSPSASASASPTPSDAASGSAQGGTERTDDEESWQEPENTMNLVRFFHGRYYQRQYARINEFLVGNVSSTDVQQNLAQVGAWLEREQKAGKNLFLNEATLEALEQLHGLSRVHDEDVRCSRHSYAILLKNDRATGGRAHRPPSKLTPPRRVDAIVHQVGLAHAIECYNVYPRKYAQIRAGMDSESRLLVESFLDNVLGSRDNVSSKIKTLADYKEVDLRAYETIERHSHSDPDRKFLGLVVDERAGKMAVDAERVGQLVHRYLVAPCQYFVRKLGPDVFVPARFDAATLEEEDRYQATSRELVEFLHGWLHYRLCDALVNGGERQLAKKVVALIQRESAKRG